MKKINFCIFLFVFVSFFFNCGLFIKQSNILAQEVETNVEEKTEGSLSQKEFMNAVMPVISKYDFQGDIPIVVIWFTKEYFVGFSKVDKEETPANLDSVLSTFSENYVFGIVPIDIDESKKKINWQKLDKLSVLKDSMGKTYPVKIAGKALQDMIREEKEGQVLIVTGVKEGKSVLSKDAKWITLIIKNFGGAKRREFKWNIPLEYPDLVKELMK